MVVQLGKNLIHFVPPRLDVEAGEWERDGVGKVHFKPLLWTSEPPKRPGFYWCRFRGSNDRQVFQVKADVEYVAGDVEWSSAPIPEPWG